MKTIQPTNKIDSFASFWPFYLSEHKNKISRNLHYFGTISSNLFLLFIIWQQSWLLLPLVLLLGYAPAWIGHFLLEKNRPATFQYPRWSLMADYKMLYLALKGEISSELDKHS